MTECFALIREIRVIRGQKTPKFGFRLSNLPVSLAATNYRAAAGALYH